MFPASRPRLVVNPPRKLVCRSAWPGFALSVIGLIGMSFSDGPDKQCSRAEGLDCRSIPHFAFSSRSMRRPGQSLPLDGTVGVLRILRTPGLTALVARMGSVAAAGRPGRLKLACAPRPFFYSTICSTAQPRLLDVARRFTAMGGAGRRRCTLGWFFAAPIPGKFPRRFVRQLPGGGTTGRHSPLRPSARRARGRDGDDPKGVVVRMGAAPSWQKQKIAARRRGDGPARTANRPRPVFAAIARPSIVPEAPGAPAPRP